MRYYFCMSTKHIALGILIGLAALAFGGPSPSIAEAPEPEFGAEKLPANVGEARRQDFQIVDWKKVPKAECEGNIRQLVEQLRSWDRHFGPFGIECARANITGGRWPDLLVDLRGADPDLNDSRLEGHRVWVLRRESEQGNSWRVVLKTQAMEIGIKSKEVASVQPDGIVRYAWDGRSFIAGPPYSNSHWIAALDVTKDGFRHRVWLTVLPGKDPPEGMPYGGDRVSAECQVTNLRTGNVRTYRGTGHMLLRQEVIGGDVGQPLGSFELWLPDFGGHPRGYLAFPDPRCGSGVPSFEQAYGD